MHPAGHQPYGGAPSGSHHHLHHLPPPSSSYDPYRQSHPQSHSSYQYPPPSQSHSHSHSQPPPQPLRHPHYASGELLPSMRSASEGEKDEETGGQPKLRLACLACRSKKAKCSGDKPKCAQCTRSNLTCVWPDGRRRKRTKKEMEEDMGAHGVAQLYGEMSVGHGGAVVMSVRDEKRTDSRSPSQSGQGSGSGYQGMAPRGVSDSDRSHKQPRLASQDYVHQPMGSASIGGVNSGNGNGTGSNLPFGGLPSDPSPASASCATRQTPFSQSYALPQTQFNTSQLPIPDQQSGASTLSYPGFSAPIGQHLTSFPIADSPRTNALLAELLKQHNLADFSFMGSGLPDNLNPVPLTSSATINHITEPPSATFQQALPPSYDAPSDAFNSNIALPGPGPPASSDTKPSTADPVKVKQEEALIKAIQDQVGFVSVDDTESEPFLRLYYFRSSGSTSIHPGINRICLKLRLKPSETPSSSGGASNRHLSSVDRASLAVNSPQAAFGNAFFDSSTDMPPPGVYMPLCDTFFTLLAQHFPSIQPRRIYKRIEDGTMSALLLNSMCALASRFSSQAKGNKANAGNVFMDKACELLIPAIRFPNTDAVTSLLLMAQSEFGQNNESGAWHFTGLAIRMAEELGFYRNTDEMYEDAGHFRRNKLLFWSIFIADRLLSLNTGRPTTIREDQIEIPLPEDEDMIPTPLPEGADDTVRPEPFVKLTRMMVIIGRISDLLNGSRGVPRTFGSSAPADLAGRVESLQQELDDYYKSLPASLTWDATNFRNWIGRHKGGVFLTLHCVANSVLALLFHPAILASPNGAETPMSRAMNRSIKESLISARLVCDTIVYANLCNPLTYMASPQITQALYIAGLAFVFELQRSKFEMAPSEDDRRDGKRATPDHPDTLRQIVAEQNLDELLKALKQLESVWAGAGVSLYVLSKRAQGVGAHGIDFEKSSEAIGTFVSVPDSGVLKRFTGDIGGGDETSPAAHLANVLSGQSPAIHHDQGEPVSLETLLASYAVDDMQVESNYYDPALFAMMEQMQNGNGMGMAK